VRLLFFSSDNFNKNDLKIVPAFAWYNISGMKIYNTIEKYVMKNIRYFLTVLVIASSLNFFGCANGGNESKGTDTTAITPTGPAPDNSAATNPSLGDTLHDNRDTNATDTTNH
jgi:hypothetical protein